MADIKNYGLVGVGSALQFGKGGSQIIFAESVFSLKSQDSASLVNLSVAAPTSDDHAVTKGYLTEALGNLNSARITDSASSPTALVATDIASGYATIQATNGTTMENVALFNNEAGADTWATITGNVGEVFIGVHTADVSGNANIHIAPEGEGEVVLGVIDADASMQAELGRNLTLSGGDGDDENSIAGGNLILRGGQGTAGGSVFIMGSKEDVIATFSSGATSTNQVAFTSGTTAFTVGVVGTETDIDVKLAPKGTGVVDVSSAKIANVADGVADNDAVNVGQLNTAIAAVDTAVDSALVDSSATSNGIISTATNNIGVTVKGTVRKVTVIILTPYSPGTEITVGDASVADSLLSANDLDESEAGTTEVSLYKTYATATQLIATVTGGPSQGSARIIVDYTKG